MQYVDVVSCLWFLSLTLKFSCLFTAVAVLACLRSLIVTVDFAISFTTAGSTFELKIKLFNLY